MTELKSYYFNEVYLKALKKREEKEDLLSTEYTWVEQVPPARGQPDLQHKTMVKMGLCRAARANKLKNRYCNLFPFDKNLVDMQPSSKSYINASWLKLPWIPDRKFIATMGPMHPSSHFSGKRDNTCPDFWHMVWNTRAKLVVMLCEIAQGFAGCSQYFPLAKGETVTHGDFTIRVASLEENEHYVIRDLLLSEANSGGETQSVKHFQFLKWPNYGVPEEVAHISKFLTCVYEQAKDLETKDPEFIVHCSGGIGRSGTFLTAYGAYAHFRELEHVPQEGAEEVNLADTVEALRLQRHPWMVEGMCQYKMAYDIVIELLKSLKG